MQASPTYNLHTRKNRLPSNRPICAHLRSSADKNGLPARTSSQSLFSTGFWQTADIDDIRFTGSNLKTTTTFTCNNANELTSMTMTPGGTTTFTYDDWGRMTQKANSGFTADYAYRYGSMLYNVDSNFPGEGQVTYEYGGTRTARSRSDGINLVNFRWATGAGYIQQEDAGGNLVRTEYWQLGESVGADPAPGDYRYHFQDSINSNRLISDDQKSTVSKFDYDPFGQTRASEGESSVRGYANYESHGNLYTTRYRTYSPSLARWTTKDPIGITKTFNLYTYVENSPTQKTDVLGLISWDPRSTCRGYRRAIKGVFKEICVKVNKKCGNFASCANEHKLFQNADVVEKFTGYCSNTDSISVNCPETDNSCEGTEHAYAPRGMQKIVMCPYGLSNGREVAPLRCEIAHELGHIAAVSSEPGADQVMKCVFPDCYR